MKNIYRKLIPVWSYWLAEQNALLVCAHFCEQTFATFMFGCVLIHQRLPGAVLHVIVSAMCSLFPVIKSNLFQGIFLLSLSTLGVCPAVSPSLLHLLSLRSLMMNVALLIMSLSPVPHLLGDPLSAPSALFPVVLPRFLLPLPVSVLFPLSVSPSPTPLASVWWWMSLHQLLLSEGLWGLWCQRTQRTAGQAKPFPTRCSLNSSWETNEDEFGGRMCFCTKGVPSFSQSVCSSVTPREPKLYLFFSLSDSSRHLFQFIS